MFYKIVLKELTVPFKKLFSFIILPFIYPFRKKVYQCPTADDGNEWCLIEVKHKNKGLKLFIWFFLDDSIWAECGVNYNTAKHNFYKWTHSKFLNTWYWCGFRNTSCNFSHYISKGKFIKVIKAYKNKYYNYEVRQFSKGIYPYLEIWLFGLVFNVGWFHSGKFEGIKVRKKK